MKPEDWIVIRHMLPKYGERVLLSYQSRTSLAKNVVIGCRSYTDRQGEHWTDDKGANIDESVSVYAWMQIPTPCAEG